MELKKTPQKKAETHKKTFFMYGLAISLAIVLLAFEWSTGEINIDDLDTNLSENPDEWVLPPVTRPKEKIKELPKPHVEKKVVEIEMVDDKTTVEEANVDNFNSDPEPFVSIDIDDRNEDEDIEIIEPLNAWELQCQAEYPGGETQFIKDLQNMLIYPDDARQYGLEGRVYLSFVIDKNGTITDIEVLKGIHPVLDNEAVRVLSEIKTKWKPGENMGLKVPVRKRIPITFRLE